MAHILDEEFYVQRTFNLAKTSKITEEVIQQLDHLLDYATFEDYRNTLIEIYHVYIMNEYHSLPYDFKRMSGHMYFLIDFLKRADEEMKPATEDTAENTVAEDRMSYRIAI